MRHRTTFFLFVLFLTGVCVLWWTDYADIPTRQEQQELMNRLLPELVDTPPAAIARIEVDRRAGPKKDRIVVERSEGGWQLKEPVDTAADPDLVETLARNLKELRKSPFAGTIKGHPNTYGLDRPEAVVRVYLKGEKESAAAKEPAVTLDLGSTLRDRAYVRPGTGAAIEVIEPRALSALTLPANQWRDAALLRVPSFKVEGVDIKEAAPDVEIALKRDERRWKLVKPIHAPADADKAEGLVAELAALRVMETPEQGDEKEKINPFVADDVTDLARYGLDRPAMTITVNPFKGQGKPQTVKLGKPVAPDKPDEVYAMRGDQNDVVRLDVKRLHEAIPGVNGLRSQTVLDFTPARVDRLEIATDKARYDLALTRNGWRLIAPVKEVADSQAVQALLTHLAELKTSEFLAPETVIKPRLDPPDFRIKGWEKDDRAADSQDGSGSESARKPQFDLSLGRVDLLRKTVYGQIAGDPTILAIPDAILKEMPRNAFAFRDRAVLSIRPNEFASVAVEHPRSGQVVKVEAPPTTGAHDTRWRMTEPVDAPADDAAVTALLLALGNLKAERWESDAVGDGKAYGLDAPGLRVKWTLQPDPAAPGSEAARRGVLRVGKLATDGESYYANIEGNEKVFTINPGAVTPFEAELHTHKVHSFKPEDVDRLTLRWPTRTLLLRRRTDGPGWEVARGYDPTGVDVSRVDSLLTTIAGLNAPRFFQYKGRFREEYGLDRPWLDARWHLAGKPDEQVLRIGNHLNESGYVATNAPRDEGPAFVLPVDAVKEIVRPPARPEDLPEDPFVAAPATAKGP